MLDRVLVAIVGSPSSERALAYALVTVPEAPITLIYVIDPFDAVIDAEAGGLPIAENWDDNANEDAISIHATVTDFTATHETDIDTVTEVGRSAQTILEYADDHDADQVVIGSHGRSVIDRALLGRVDETVTWRTRIPETTVA